MAWVREFAPLDFLLLLSGCSLLSETRCQRALNAAFRLLMIGSHICAILSQTSVDHMRKEPLMFFMFYTDTLFGLCFLVVMHRSRAALRAILESVALLPPLPLLPWSPWSGDAMPATRSTASSAPT